MEESFSKTTPKEFFHLSICPLMELRKELQQREAAYLARRKEGTSTGDVVQPLWVLCSSLQTMSRESVVGDDQSIQGIVRDRNSNNSVHDASGVYHYAYRLNQRGRCVIVAPNGREIVALLVATDQSTSLLDEATCVAALDRLCYHVGYPLDLGDVEDIFLSDQSTLRCISCPLHNRIFDMMDGSLVVLSYGLPKKGTPVVMDGLRIGGSLQQQGCHQRVHSAFIDKDTHNVVVVVEANPLEALPSDVNFSHCKRSREPLDSCSP